MRHVFDLLIAMILIASKRHGQATHVDQSVAIHFTVMQSMSSKKVQRHRGFQGSLRTPPWCADAWNRLKR
jgi:hypothetical protein